MHALGIPSFSKLIFNELTARREATTGCKTNF